MLTEIEKKWLKARRGNRCKGGYFAFTSDSIMDFVRYHRLLTPDYKDAAEFEARVSRVMALYLGAPPCGIGKCDNPNFLCPECRLKHARLAVEEEMSCTK